jgi:hypothetical protein
MQSTATNVTDYLDEVPAERKAALTRLRELCRTELTDFEESMKYGMPAYLRNGEAEVGFASVLILGLEFLGLLFFIPFIQNMETLNIGPLLRILPSGLASALAFIGLFKYSRQG